MEDGQPSRYEGGFRGYMKCLEPFPYRYSFWYFAGVLMLSDSVVMARAYSDGLREKVLGAYASGKGTLRQLAERFELWLGGERSMRRSWPRATEPACCSAGERAATMANRCGRWCGPSRTSCCASCGSRCWHRDSGSATGSCGGC